MPRLLTEEWKNKHVNVCYDLQEDLRNDPQFLTKLQQVMRVGATAMTLSQSGSQISGSHQIRPD